jgi:RimJ/RimL family protein N-acetyltransferase
MPRLTGTKVSLREYREEDRPSVRAWVNDQEVTDKLSETFAGPHTEGRTARFFDRILSGDTGEDQFYVIAERESDVYLGQIDLSGFQWTARRATLGIVIPNRLNRGRGYGSEAIRLLLSHAFDRLNLHKVELDVYAFNEQAIAVYRQIGFVEEGRVRDHVFRRGAYHDDIKMGILAEEFRRQAPLSTS